MPIKSARLQRTSSRPESQLFRAYRVTGNIFNLLVQIAINCGKLGERDARPRR